MTANAPESTSQRLRARFVAWSALMIAMLIVFAAWVVPRLQIDTDILALLPATRDAAVDQALEHLTGALSQRQIFLIGGDTVSVAKDAAKRFAEQLSASDQFASVQAEVGGDLGATIAAYRPYWPFLLADSDRARLQSEGDDLYREALRAAYTPAGMMRPLPLAQDPLGLAGNFLIQQLPSLGSAHLDGSMLTVASGERQYVLVTAETKSSVFAASVQEAVLPVVEAASVAAKQAGNHVEIIASGALQHAAAATTQAQNEINIFGSIETVAVLALLWLVFGRLRPLLLGAVVLGLSAAASITVSHFIFGKLHILALVFGASLIGVVIDYSMHFFADQFRERERWTPASAAAHVGPAIVLGASITVLGYVGLVLMPFPGLRQIAAFCIVGIVAGSGSVLCLYPYLMGSAKRLPQRGPKVADALDAFLLRWRWTPLKNAVIAVCAVILLVGVWRVQVQDDIHALQSSPPELVRNERRVQEILGGGVETRFFLIQAPTAQAVLEREEQLRTRLDTAVARKQLGSYMALTRALPSAARQQADHQLLAQHAFNADGPFVRLMAQFGFPAPQIAERVAVFTQAAKPLTTEDWLTSPAAAAYRHLWLGEVAGHYATVVTLSGIRDLNSMRDVAAAQPDVRFVDRPLEVSEVMSRYRGVTTWLLVISSLAALAVLVWRYDLRDALRMVLPTIAACLTTLGVFGWFGVAFNLFNVFALLLVLALGVDYGIFLRHGQTARSTAILSVTLSACTKLIGFGMLAFSVTPFIRSIGITLLFGIVCSWAFVMLSCMTPGLERATAKGTESSIA